MKEPFEKRLAFVAEQLPHGEHAHARAHPHEVCRGVDHLRAELARVEARVVEHVAGAGRHKGRLGALVVEMADGTRFSVGTGFSDAERESPPAIGSIVTFRYQELSEGGVPRFPSYVRLRTDVEWLSIPDTYRSRSHDAKA